MLVLDTDRAGRQTLHWVGGIGARAAVVLSEELLAWLGEHTTTVGRPGAD